MSATAEYMGLSHCDRVEFSCFLSPVLKNFPIIKSSKQKSHDKPILLLRWTQ